MTQPINSLREASMVWLVAYIFFLFTLANNFSASHDSINYLLQITNGRNLFHQHHLLYNFFAYHWLHLIKNFLPAAEDHYIIESFTSLWGSANLAMCYLFFRNRFGLTVLHSALSVSVIAFSYGCWFYSVNIEVYSPPIFFILGCLYIITKKQLRISDVWLIAILNSLAILFHQLNILFAIVLLFRIYANRHAFNATTFIARYAATGIIIAGGIYFLTGWVLLHHNNVGDFTNWILGYTKGHSYWQPLSFKTPVNVIAGFSRSFIGGQFMFQHPAISHVLYDSFRTHKLRDEIFLSNEISPAFTWILSILTFLFVLTILAMLIRFIKHYGQIKTHFHVIQPMLACVAVYSIFFCFWMPEILEFWILQMILVWLILLGTLPVYGAPFKIKQLTLLLILSASLFVINYSGSIRWLQQMKRDWYYNEVKKLDPALTSSNMVIVEDEWILKDYVRYYSRAHVIATDEPGFNRSETGRLVADAISGGHKVYVYRFQPSSDTITWKPIRSY